MKYQDRSYRAMTAKELLNMEADIHNSTYSGSLPFMSSSLIIDLNHVWKINDFCYKKGRYLRGFRKRMLFEFMDLSNIKDKKILDVGCGNGQHAVFFALYGANVYAFDISEVGIEIGKKIAYANGVSDKCHFSIQSASNMLYDNEEFDFVVFNAVLHHVLKYPNVKNETLRVLKKGGYVFFAEGIRGNPVYRSLRSIYRRATSKRPQGDIDLEYKDILQFIQGFSEAHLEFFCLLSGIKELIGKPIDNNILVRTIFYLANKADDAILTIFPSLLKYCSESVGKLKK